MARRADVLSDDFQSHLANLEEKNGLTPGSLTKLAFIETNLGQNRSTSSAGAQGLFQFIPGTAKRFGVDVNDDYSSSAGAAKYLGMLKKRYDGDEAKAAAAYNWGEGNVDKKYDKGILPAETRNYVSMFRDGVDLNGKRQKGLDQVFARIGNPNMTAGSSQTSSNPSFDTSVFSIDDLDSNNNSATNTVEQNSVPANNQNAPIVNSQDNKSNPTFDTSVFSIDDLEPKNEQQTTQNTTQVDNSIPDLSAAQQAPASPVAQPVNSTPTTVNSNNVGLDDLTQPTVRNGITIDIKDKQMLNALNSHPDLGSYLAGLKREDEEKGTNLYNSQIDLLKKYGNAVPDVAEQSWGRKLGEGFMTGLNNLYFGGQQLVGKAIGNDELYNRGRDMQATQNATQDALDALQGGGALRTTGQIVGESLPFLAAAPVSVASNATRVGRVANAAANGALGSVFTGTEASSDDYVEDRAKTAAIGAVAAPAVGGVINAVARPIAKVISGRAPDAAREAQQEAAREGITLLNSDLPGVSERGKAIADGALRGNSIVQNASNANNEKAAAAVQRLADDAKNFDHVNYVNNNTNIAQALRTPENPYNSEAQSLADYVTSIDPTDPVQVLKSTAMAKNLSNKIESNKLYQDAYKSVPNDSFAAIATQNSLKTLRYLADNATDKNQARELRSVADRFDVNDFNSFPLSKVENLRQSISTVINDYSANPLQNKSANSQIINSLNKVKGALDTDVDNFANAIGDDDFISKYNKARTYYEKNVAPLNEGPNRGLFNINYTENPDSINKLLKNDYNLKTVMANIDDEGKQAIQSGVINHLLNKATNSDGAFNPKAFTNAYDSFRNKSTNNNPLNTVFGTGNGVSTRLNSLSKIVSNMNKTVNEGPQNGYQVYRLLAQHAPKIAAVIGGASGAGLSGALGGLLTGAAAGAASKAVKNSYAKVLTNPKYSKFMFEFAQTNPKSDQFLKRADKFISILSANGLNDITDDEE